MQYIRIPETQQGQVYTILVQARLETLYSISVEVTDAVLPLDLDSTASIKFTKPGSRFFAIRLFKALGDLRISLTGTSQLSV